MIKFPKVKPYFTSHHDTLHNIYTSMKPIYGICKLIGLNTIRIGRKGELKQQKSDYFYFSFYIILYTLLSVYSLFQIATNENNELVISKHLVFVECFVMMALTLIVTLFTFLVRGTLIKSFDMLSHVDVSFIKAGFRLEYKQLLKKSYLIMSFVLFSLLARVPLMLMTISADFIQQIMLFISALIKAFSKYQFVVFVVQLQHRFGKINSIMRSFYIDNNQNDKTPPISDHLYFLCRLHYKLTSVLQKINSAFAVQLLVSIAVSLFNVLFQAYYLYYVATGKASFVTVPMIVCPVVWLMDEVVEIYLLVHACASTCEYANDTPTILHELRNSYFNMDLENNIQSYSLQLLHQKVQFSVLGFFVVDYTLVYSIVGAVTTYLVIFIQFDQSSNSQNSYVVTNNNTNPIN
ncbi:putative gustatory receptor 28b [Tribolium madens]|uniref:putative gustatory receptor 28b n=1 Tax=Tribolium madens TaxID=41895 RepID=UPI001CF7449A|nr:putative gustatory receptor 28b [Tribolium madens]